jgi:hypothetical protein
MKTTYVTLKPDMARAYREKLKRNTRRVIKWPKWLDPALTDTSLERIAEIINSNKYRGVVKRGRCDGIENQFRCPYGCPGDQLILGTTWSVPKELDHLKPTELPVGYLAGLPVMTTSGTGAAFNPIPIWSYFDGYKKPEGFGKLRPGRFLPNKLRDRMPRETLEIVRAEMVQDITEKDAVMEGVSTIHVEIPPGPSNDFEGDYRFEYVDYMNPGEFAGWNGDAGSLFSARESFQSLWDSINAARGYSWDSNPWVWVLGW